MDRYQIFAIDGKFHVGRAVPQDDASREELFIYLDTNASFTRLEDAVEWADLKNQEGRG